MADNKKKTTGNGQDLKSHRASIRFEIAFFIIWSSIVSLFKNIIFTMVPAADKRAGGRFSNIVHAIFAVLTLEGPRLLLMSRYRASRMETGTKVGLSAVSGTAIAAIAIATIIVSSQLMAVTVDGRVVGYVENKEQYDTLLQRAKEKLSEQVGTENTTVLVQETGVSLEPVIAPQQAPMTPAADLVDAAEYAQPASDGAGDPAQEGDGGIPGGGENAADPAVMPGDGEEALVDMLIDSLLDGSAVMATVYTITINDEIMATLGSFTEASAVLNMIADAYKLPGKEGEWTHRFLDDVSINGVTTDLDKVVVQNPDDVVAFLLGGITEDKAYTAAEEDNIGNICGALGLSEAELRALYGDYDFDLIREGDVFKTTLTFPYVRFETACIETAVEELAFDTVEENTNSLYLGQREVKEEGTLGEREVTKTVTRVNGRVTSTVEINSVTLKDPIPEVVYVGTMMVGYDAYVGPSDGWGGGGNGPLGRPLNSWYLSRSVGGGHAGADMISVRGAPIFAAEYGVVTFAGVYGGYGNFIVIDHGNGLTTGYAHCDTINVGTGQTVMRGQQIATVGSTGRSSAYHLHFEVRVGGVAQEPLSWIG